MRLIPISNNLYLHRRNMKIAPTLTLLSAALLASAPATAFELEHSEGVLTLPSPPQKIVSFELGVLDTLTALDIPVAGVPKSQYEGALAQHKETRVVGTLFEPDYDVLKEIKPDLIIAGGRSQKAVPELSKLAPTIGFKSDPNSFLADFHETNLALAKAFGREEQAKAALAQIDGTLKALQEVNKGKTGAFLFTIRGNVIPHVPGDRFGYAYELTGLNSVLPAKDPNAPVVPRPEPGSPEAKAAAEERARTVAKLAAAEPDWLLVLDRGAINGGEHTAKATLEQHPELSKTKAFQDGRVVYLDPNGWYVIGGGLNNLRQISEDLLAAMKK